MNHQIQTVPFHGQTLSVIPQQDKLYVAIKPICENMGVLWEPQRKRIQRNEVLSEGASMMEVPSKGGYQETVCLPLELLNGWLFGIDANRIKDPTVKARVIEYQRECYKVLFDYWFKGASDKPAKPEPQANTIDATQQALLLELINLRTSESVPELQQAVKNVVSSQVVKAFGCTIDQLPQDKYEEAIGVILNATIEGELLPTSQPNTNPHLEAELKKIAIAVDRYYYKEHGTNFIDGLLILKELHQYVPSDVHTLLKQLEGVLVSGWTHADESLCRLKAATTMLERWRGPKAKYNELLLSRL